MELNFERNVYPLALFVNTKGLCMLAWVTCKAEANLCASEVFIYRNVMHKKRWLRKIPVKADDHCYYNYYCCCLLICL